MSYSIVIIIGLVVCVLLFIQLRNETRAQNRQIKTAFDNLVLEVHCTPNQNAGPIIRPGQQAPVIKYPVISTSITCGRKSKKNHYQIDLPIETGDKSLADTAAEFTIEPDGDCLHMYVRRLEQPLIWVISSDYMTVQCLADDSYRTPDNPVGAEDKKILRVPQKFQKNKQQKYLRQDKIPLQLGDIVLMGDTMFIINYEKEED